MSFVADIGFKDFCGEDRLRNLTLMCEHGELIETKGCKYLKWAVDERLELWTKVVDGTPDGYYQPYYSGDARMKIALLEKMPRSSQVISDGAFLCRSKPFVGDGFIGGKLGFVFDTPEYHRYADVDVPRIVTAQLTGFGFEVHGYADEEEFDEAYPADEEGYCWDYRYFVPAYMLRPRGEGNELQSATAQLSGFVVETDIVTNPVTGFDFCWAKVDTIGGEVDIVCSPNDLNGYLTKGGVATARCYLYGRLIEDTSN